MALRALSLVAFIVFMLCSCGPSADEIRMMKEQETARVDSIKAATKAEIEAKEMEQQQARENAAEAQMIYQGLAQRVIEAKADLAVAEDVLARVSTFQVGRSRGERSEQIHRATTQVEERRARLQKLEEQLPEAKQQAEEMAARVSVE